MVQPTSKLLFEVIFYQDQNTGKEPAREWFLALRKVDQRKIGRQLNNAQHTWPIGMPYARNMRKGL